VSTRYRAWACNQCANPIVAVLRRWLGRNPVQCRCGADRAIAVPFHGNEEGPDSIGRDSGQRPSGDPFWASRGTGPQRRVCCGGARQRTRVRRLPYRPGSMAAWPRQGETRQPLSGATPNRHAPASCRQGGPSWYAGRWLERASNGATRGMIVRRGNPVYRIRPIDLFRTFDFSGRGSGPHGSALRTTGLR